ncbi:MAG TPA: hypothetical protein VMU08_00285 [Rhizomicrobium sp.]|nr:hypothetical protein [Rhizomicrobium sp.]
MSAATGKKTPDAKETLDEKIDQQMEDTFPASDPPSYSGGKHIVGAPRERWSDAPKPNHPAVKKAEKKVKSGDAKAPKTY